MAASATTTPLALIACAVATLFLNGCQCSKGKISATADGTSPAASILPTAGVSAGGGADAGGGGVGAISSVSSAARADELPFNVAIKGAVTVRPGATGASAGASLTGSETELVASDYRVEALRISSGQTKVELLAKTKTGTTGQYDVSVEKVMRNDTLLIVAYKDKVSTGQTLLPLSSYTPNGKNRLVEININVSTTTSIATWILLKKDINFEQSLTPDKLRKVEKLVDATLETLGPAAKSKSMLELAELVLASPRFLDDLERIFSDTIKDRDSCDAKSWDFLRERLPVQDVFGEPSKFLNLAPGLVAGSNGIFSVSPSRLVPSSSLVWSGHDADLPIDQVVLELLENDLKSGISCYDPQTASFGAECPTKVLTVPDGDGSWKITVDSNVLRAGGLYTGALKAINSTCNAVLAQASASLLWDNVPPKGSFAVAGGSLFTSHAAINLSIEDSSGVNFYALGEGATACGAEPTAWQTYSSGPLSAQLSSGDGLKTVCLKVKDDVGNISDWVQRTVTLDTAAPSATVSTSGTLTAASTAGSYTTLSGTALDTTSGIAAVQVSIMDQASGLCYTPGTGFSFCPNWLQATGQDSWTLDVLDAAFTSGHSYEIAVRSRDNAANLSDVTTSTATWQEMPAAPGSLVATASSATAASLSWTDYATNEAGFYVDISTDGTSFSQLTSLGIDVTSYSATGLTAGTTYYFRVQSFGAGGVSASSNVAQVTLFAVPPAPTGLVATAGNASTSLVWNAATGASTYAVLRSTTSGSGYVVIAASVSGLSYSDATAANGTTYYYAVSATNISGTSNRSAEVSATPAAPPTAPTTLTATAASGSAVNLAWNDNSASETGFKVERSLNGTTYTLLATLSANATTYSDSGLSAGQIYYYRVFAFNAVSASIPTTVASATPPTLPSAPSALAALNATAGSIDLTWTDNASNESGYVVEHSLNGSSGWTVITTTVANAAGYTDIGLTAATAYYYRVKAINVAGSSGYSSVANATTLLTPMNAPSGLSVTGPTQTTLNLAWTDNSADETGFVVERSANGTSGWTVLTTTAADALSHQDTGLTAGTAYYYRIKAIKSGGASSYTASQSATTLPLAPAAPSAVTVGNSTQTTLDIGWTDNSANETGFTVERSLDGSTSWTALGTVAADQTSYQNTGLTAATTYYYRVKAINTGGSSSYTSVGSATTLPSAPAAPSALTVTASGQTTLDLAWTDNASNETGFVVEMSANGTSGWSVVTTTAAGVVTYQNTGLVAATAYYYRIKAINTGGSIHAKSIEDARFGRIQIIGNGLKLRSR